MAEIRIEIEDDERIFYDTGKIFSKKSGQFVGSKDKYGYLTCDVGEKTKKIHRIIYEKFIGPIPEGYHVNHKNWLRDDNRIENLEAITREQNIANRQKQKSNTSGIIGVSKDRNRWRADNRAKHLNGGKLKYIGSFDTPELAGLARDAYVINNHLNFHILNFPSCRLRPLNWID